MAKVKMSCCMVVKDEEEFIGAALDSIQPHVYEIIVVDTGSTDKTKEICLDKKRFPKVKFFEKKFVPWSFKNARNYSISKAKGNWIMYMDADEVFEGSIPDHLPEAIHNFQIMNKTDNGDYVNSFCARMIPNLKGVKFINDVHEIFASTQKELPITKFTHGHIKHFGYLNYVREAKDKLNRNIDMLTEDHKNNPTSQNCYYLGQELFIKKEFERARELALDGIERLKTDNALDMTFEPILYHLLLSASIEGKRPHEEIEEIEEKYVFKRVNPEVPTVLVSYYLGRHDPMKAGFYCMQAMKYRNTADLPVKYNEATIKYAGYILMGDYYLNTVGDQLAALYWYELAFANGLQEPGFVIKIYQLLPKNTNFGKLEFILDFLWKKTQDKNFLKELSNVLMNQGVPEKELKACELMNQIGTPQELQFFADNLKKNGKDHLIEKVNLVPAKELDKKDNPGKLTVIIPTMMMADLEYLKYNIEQLRATDAVEKIIIVDNSEDKQVSPWMAKEDLLPLGKVEILQDHNGNLGFNGSVNAAMEHVETPYHLTLNDDCLTRDTVYDSIVNILENQEDAGVVVVQTKEKEPLENYKNYNEVSEKDSFLEYDATQGSQYGWCIAGKKEIFEQFDERLQTFYGDNLQHWYAYKNNLKTYVLTSDYVSHEVSKTVNQLLGQLKEGSDYKKALVEEGKIFNEIVSG